MLRTKPLTRKTPLKPGTKRMKQRHRAIPPPTKAEQAYQDAARALGCVVCRYRIAQGWQSDQPNETHIHHRNGGDQHGQKQIGQHAVVALCAYHHDGVPKRGWNDAHMREAYGPSFKLHARDFRIWTDDAIGGRGTEAWQRYQDQLLAGRQAA
jgi:hypothetical protein